MKLKLPFSGREYVFHRPFAAPKRDGTRVEDPTPAQRAANLGWLPIKPKNSPAPPRRQHVEFLRNTGASPSLLGVDRCQAAPERNPTLSGMPSLEDTGQRIDSLPPSGQSPAARDAASADAARLVHKTAADLAIAISKLDKWDDQVGMAKAVIAHVGRKLKVARMAGRQPLILLGDNHGSPCSLMIAMAAMQAARLHGVGNVTVMVELDPATARSFAEGSTDMLERRMPRSGDAGAAANVDRLLELRMCGSDTKKRCDWLLGAKMHTARRLDFDVTGFDLRTGETGSRREQGMVDGIRRQLDAGDAPVIVVTGGLHLPELRDRLAPRAEVIAVALVDKDLLNDTAPQEIPRASYLIAHPAVKRIGVAPGLDSRFKYTDFAGRIGIDLSRAD